MRWKLKRKIRDIKRPGTSCSDVVHLSVPMLRFSKNRPSLTHVSCRAYGLRRQIHSESETFV